MAESRNEHIVKGFDDELQRLDNMIAELGGLAERQLADARGVFVSASDYLCALGEGISRWVPGPYVVLGTDGYGLSEARDVLRDHFEVSAPWIAHAVLSALEQAGRLEEGSARAAALEWGLDLGRVDPAIA